jgi:hypothetical protein
MKTTTKNTGIKVNTGVKAGGWNGGQMGGNHNRNGLRIRTSVKVGTMIQSANHSRQLLALE